MLFVALALAVAPVGTFAEDVVSDPSQSNRPDDFVLRRISRVSLAWDSNDARQKALNFLGSQQAHVHAIDSLQQCQGCHGSAGASAAWDTAAISALQPQGPWIGISVGPADGVLRSQLRLPEGTGVVVTQVVPNGPAQQSGVEEHDVLLSVNDKPVAAGEDLDKILQAFTPGAAPLTLKLLKHGQAVEKQVTPRKSDAKEWLSAFVAHPAPAFRIGLQASEPDETLKRQLNLASGVVVTEVEGGKPADAAGVKSGDVLLSVNGAPIVKHDDLPEMIRSSGGSPVELELMRGGVRLKLSVTPVKEEAGAAAQRAYIQYVLPDQTRELLLLQPKYAELLTQGSKGHEPTPATQPTSAAERLRQITSQLEQLQREVGTLQGELEKQQEARPKQ
jgi:membrane-associated protease RseP (regulator of RpoE activity)